ncbi:MAG TPA: alkaline phosphatase D family protein [Coleofasciculaceae cyanobacterium]
MAKHINRRKFLKYSLATTVLVWAGEEIPRHLGLSLADVKQLFSINPAVAASSVFPQSVASGDPQSNGITLWTRVVPQATNPKVAIEIADNSSFTGNLLRGMTAPVNASLDFTVKATVSTPTLKPFQTYYYRFIHNGVASPIGRFKTLPEPGANLDKVRFVYLSCQDYTAGYYTPLSYLAEEDIDFVVHLGDYIYENVGDRSSQSNRLRPIVLPSGNPQAETLDDYRFLYKTYKSDPNLQRVHERFAFITIWDDHEFANDSYREYSTDTPNESQNRNAQRRQAANQAWAEYTATSVPFKANEQPLNSLKIYRSFVFGNLLELVMTDERLYRDAPPCGLEQRYLSPGCANQNNPQRTMLGNPQKPWFLNTIRQSPCTWKIWGNEVMFMQLKVLGKFASELLQKPTPDLYISLDQWDGYPAERAEILRTLRDAGVKNFITITGDIHSFAAGYQKVNFDNPLDPNVGICFVGGSVTSSNFSEMTTFSNGMPVPPIEQVTQVLRASNPHLEYFNSVTHGYNVIEATPEAVTCTMKAVDTIKQPQANLSILKVFRVPRDKVVIQDVGDESTG